MSKAKGAVFATLALVAFGLSSQAAADEIESGWYLGADLGHVELQLEDRGNISNKN